MQEIKKRRIVLASVLKPVNDPRMFEKIGQSLSHHYEVHIIGTRGTVINSSSSIFFHPLSVYKRLGLDRILAPLRILKKILSLKPGLVIISTHELLWVVLVIKVFLRCGVIYDVRENYFRNILYTNAFPPIVRVFIALYVRIKEWITSPLINIFFLAEAGYTKELSFVGRNKIILENKVKKIELPPKQKWSTRDHQLHLLFSGTLAVTTGVFIAIDIVTKLHAVDPAVKLHIIGFSPISAVQREIKNAIGTKDFIHFKNSEEPVSHVEILNAVQQADLGIIAYPPNFSTENTIPTKLFEYLGYALPILLIDHAPWVEICKPYNAAIHFDADNFNASETLAAFRGTAFYTKSPENVFWQGEEEKLLQTIAPLVK
jgi:hypothetical protein